MLPAYIHLTARTTVEGVSFPRQRLHGCRSVWACSGRGSSGWASVSPGGVRHEWEFPPPRLFPAFCVQIRTTGKTGGCEWSFLQDVSELLSCQAVALKVEQSGEHEGCLLLVFCPIASLRVTNVENALEGLTGKKLVLGVGSSHCVPLWRSECR